MCQQLPVAFCCLMNRCFGRYRCFESLMLCAWTEASYLPLLTRFGRGFVNFAYPASLSLLNPTTRCPD